MKIICLILLRATSSAHALHAPQYTRSYRSRALQRASTENKKKQSFFVVNDAGESLVAEIQTTWISFVTHDPHHVTST